MKNSRNKVHDRFLQLIDEGAFINGAGETISCRSIIIIMTSNAGAEVYCGQTIGFSFTENLTAMKPFYRDYCLT